MHDMAKWMAKHVEEKYYYAKHVSQGRRCSIPVLR